MDHRFDSVWETSNMSGWTFGPTSGEGPRACWIVCMVSLEDLDPTRTNSSSGIITINNEIGDTELFY